MHVKKKKKIKGEKRGEKKEHTDIKVNRIISNSQAKKPTVIKKKKKRF